MHAAALAEQRSRRRDLSSLRWLASGGSGLPAGVLEELERELQVPVVRAQHLSVGYRSRAEPASSVLKPGVEATIDEIAEFVKERVAAYEYPRIVWIVGDLPLGPTGKVLKRAINRSVTGRTAGHSR